MTMLGDEIESALKERAMDGAMVSHFLAVWPVVTTILEAFSVATQLPIFAYLNSVKVFQSSMKTMPPFCASMLASKEMAVMCVDDGRRRASKKEPDIGSRKQLCHAGMVNIRREIQAGGVGVLTILFGAKKATTPEAINRRNRVIQAAELQDRAVAEKLRWADTSEDLVGEIESSDSRLLNVISDLIQQLLEATVGFRSGSINMAHELVLMLLGMGLHVKVMEKLMSRLRENPSDPDVNEALHKAHSMILAESRLGLYVVRNFLSHASEHRYREVIRPQFAPIKLSDVLSEMVELHKAQADAKGISFEITGGSDMPMIHGHEMEIRRLFYNVLNNAIKYSYHSIPGAQRMIRIKTKVPYDPGFQAGPRFAIAIDNYGLGLSKEEAKYAYKAGFRGEQAVREVPNGAGIGLSEAMKIMKAHRGRIKLRSEEVHEDALGERTYLTTVELIFPLEMNKR